MTKTISRYLGLFLLPAIVWAGLPATLAQRPDDRPRVTTTTEARPSPSPTPYPAGDPARSNPQASPSPSPSPAQFKVAQTTKTLGELQSRISEVLGKPELAPAIIGVKVASLDTGRVLFEENSQKLLRPASNMKLYTVAAALDRLSPEYRFQTSVFAAARPDAAGIVHGDLTIFGRGDPSLAARFHGGNYTRGIEELANRIVSAGVKRVEGDLVGDETYFTGPPYGSGWEWEDLQWWYGAEVSSLSINDNALDLSIKPGAKVGAPAVITTGPPDPLLTIVNHATTAPSGTKRDITIHRGLGTHVLEVVGTIPLDDRGYTGGIGISHPAMLFVYLLRSSLAKRGVVITGRSRTVPASASGAPVTGADKVGLVEIVSLPSPPLSLIAAQTLKPSQNMYTELLLRTLGKTFPNVGANSGGFRSSEAAGREVLKEFLKEAGIDPAGLVLSDGSGLSRNDLISPEATLQLLVYMSKHQHAHAFREALPIAGVDGTLRNRLKGTAAENNVRAKTGTLSSAAGLSGYVTTASGERLVFSIIANNYPEGVEPRSLCIDPIVVLLASFAGRS